MYDPNATPQTHPFFQPTSELFIAYQEIILLVRHPSLARLSPSPTFSAESLEVSLRSSREILHAAQKLKQYNMLSMHHHVATVVMLATFTILYSLWTRGDNTSTGNSPPEEEIKRVEQEMKASQDLLGEIEWTDPTKIQKMIQLLTRATVDCLHQRGERSRTTSGAQGTKAPVDHSKRSNVQMERPNLYSSPSKTGQMQGNGAQYPMSDNQPSASFSQFGFSQNSEQQADQSHNLPAIDFGDTSGFDFSNQHTRPSLGNPLRWSPPEYTDSPNSPWSLTTGWNEWMNVVGQQASTELDPLGGGDVPWQVEMPLQQSGFRFE